MNHRVPAWQPIAESVAVVVLIAAGLIALASSLPNAGSFDGPVLYRAGALSTEAAWSEPWRLLACTWLHADAGHLAGNLVFLLLMSVLLTRALGWDRFLLIYLGSGLAGSLVSVLVEQPVLAVGASGAIFGLTGATVAYAIHPREVFHETEVLSAREALLPIAGMQLLFSFLPGVSWGAHLGGFGFGFLCAVTGLADVGLPARASGQRLPGVRWLWVISATLMVIALSACSGWITLALLALYVAGLVLSGRSGPDWRPDLSPVVIGAALGALGIHAAAVGVALHVGDPWGLRSERGEPPPSSPVSLPGGLGEVPLPDALIAARVEEPPVLRYGSREAFPFALELEVGPREAPERVIRRMIAEPLDGRQRVLDAASWGATCPWFAWTTGAAAGMVVFTEEAVVDVRLLRLGRPSDPGWRKAEDALVSALYSQRDCAAAGWTPGELGIALAEAGLSDEAIAALGKQLNLTPEEPGPRLLRARLFLETEACHAALLDYEALSKEVPEDPAAWAGLSRATLGCGTSRQSLADAEAAAARAVALDPRHVEGLEAWADAQIAMGERERAAESLRAAAAAARTDSERIRLEDRASKAARGFIVRDRIGG